MINAPVIHVNGDGPEVRVRWCTGARNIDAADRPRRMARLSPPWSCAASQDVVFACQIAIAYRQKFRRDVIVDLITYRRWGHNELDEPAFTQPIMYRNIRSRKSVPTLYEEKVRAQSAFPGPNVGQRRVFSVLVRLGRRPASTAARRGRSRQPHRGRDHACQVL